MDELGAKTLEDKARDKLDSLLRFEPVHPLPFDHPVDAYSSDTRALRWPQYSRARPQLLHVPALVEINEARIRVAHFISYGDPLDDSDGTDSLTVISAGKVWKAKLEAWELRLKLSIEVESGEGDPSTLYNESFRLVNPLEPRAPWAGPDTLLLCESDRRPSLGMYLNWRLPSCISMFEDQDKIGTACWRTEGLVLPPLWKQISFLATDLFQVLTRRKCWKEVFLSDGDIVQVHHPRMNKLENWILAYSLAVMFGHSVWPTSRTAGG